MNTTAFKPAALLLGAVLTLAAGCQLGGRTFDSSMGRTPHATGAPVAKSPGDKEALDVQLALARTLEQQQDQERAAVLYEKILQQHPKSGEAAHRLAILHDQGGRFDQSGPLFQQALKLQPGKAEVFCDLGYSQYLQRRWSEAEMNLRQAVAIQPRFQRAHNHLGMLLVQTDRRDEALVEFRRAGCTIAQSHLNCAVALVVGRRPDEAREEYELALESGPVSEDLQARMDRLIPAAGGVADHVPPIQLTSGVRSSGKQPENNRVSRR